MLDEIETGTTIFIDANIFLYEILEIGREVYGISLECSKKYGLLSNDAVHPVTMKRHGITNIATNDRDFERAPWLNIQKS